MPGRRYKKGTKATSSGVSPVLHHAQPEAIDSDGRPPSVDMKCFSKQVHRAVVRKKQLALRINTIQAIGSDVRLTFRWEFADVTSDKSQRNNVNAFVGNSLILRQTDLLRSTSLSRSDRPPKPQLRFLVNERLRERLCPRCPGRRLEKRRRAGFERPLPEPRGELLDFRLLHEIILTCFGYSIKPALPWRGGQRICDSTC
jgi:hypothetical protein